MAYKRKRLDGIVPPDVLQVDPLDGPHLAIAVAFSFSKDDLEVLVFDIGFYANVFEIYVPDLGRAVANDAECGVTAGTSGAACPKDVTILHSYVLDDPSV